MFDTLIQNGTIIDGAGSAQADVAIMGDRIAAVGSMGQADARERVDAAGRVVCPGFIDAHNHSDSSGKFGVLKIPHADNLIRQGITTLIGAHCGGSGFPIAEHLDECSAERCHSNLATLVGYSTVKGRARRGKPAGNPTPEEMREIERLLHEAMEQGALGLTTGPLGQPQSACSTDELVAASKVVAQYGGVYDSHIRDEGEWGRHIDAIEEVVTIARDAGISAEISHIKLWGRKAWGDAEKVLSILDQASRDGLRVNADQYPYHGGYRGVSGLLFRLRKDYSNEDLFGDKKDVAIREIEDQLYQLGGPQNVLLCPHDADPDLDGKSLEQVADSQGKTYAQCAWELCQRPNLSACWLAMREQDVRAFMQCPHVMVGTDGHLRELNDGYCHPRNYGTYPRILGRYVREDAVLTLPQAIHKMTQMPADKYGILGRGKVQEGSYADLVVFDPNTVIDNASWQQPHQYPNGIEHVIVNGRFAVRDGRATDERPGRVLRRADQ